MTEVDLAAMFLLGLLGAGHCVGMCGPIVVGLPSGDRAGSHLTYHLGRITTYSAIGATLAAVGGGLSDVARLQVVFSLVSAVFLFGFGLSRLGVWREPPWMLGLSPSRMPGFKLVARGLARGTVLALFPFGLMMGLLPCGLSYAAFARALAAPSAVEGARLVFAFGLGTAPALLLVGTAASRFAREHQAAFQLLSGVLMVGMGTAIALDAARALVG